MPQYTYKSISNLKFSRKPPFVSRLEEAKKWRSQDRETINKLNQQLSELEGEIRMLRRTNDSLDAERVRDKGTIARLQEELEKLRVVSGRGHRDESWAVDIGCLKWAWPPWLALLDGRGYKVGVVPLVGIVGLAGSRSWRNHIEDGGRKPLCSHRLLK